ncbi:MAG: hypothetical protein NTY66_01420 [Candidatus Vogelbacteria bacterium]|nr:hypothetical protein [Candidatus Vogelbacteria bacterium]
MFLIIDILVPLAILGFIAKAFVGRKSNNKEGAFKSVNDFLSQFYLIAATAFLGVTVFSWNRQMGNVLTGEDIFLATALVGLLLAYGAKASFTLAVSLISFEAWIMSKVASFSGLSTNAYLIVSFALLMGVLFYLIGLLHKRMEISRPGFYNTYTVINTLVVFVVLFMLSTRAMYGASLFMGGTSTNQVVLFQSPPAFLVSFLAVFILIIIVAALSYREANRKELASLLGLSFITLALTFSGDGSLLPIVYSLALFALILGLIFSGSVGHEKWRINLGVVLLIIFILVKYTDWLVGFMDKSLFFIGLGLILFIVGWYLERLRRKMIAEIDASGSVVASPSLPDPAN